MVISASLSKLFMPMALHTLNGISTMQKSKIGTLYLSQVTWNTYCASTHNVRMVTELVNLSKTHIVDTPDRLFI